MSESKTECNPELYFRSTPFPDPRTGRMCGVWVHGVRTILPPCDHIAMVTMIGANHATILVVPRDDVARLAERWWRSCACGKARLEECPEDEWWDLVADAKLFAVDETGHVPARKFPPRIRGVSFTSFR